MIREQKRFYEKGHLLQLRVVSDHLEQNVFFPCN